MNTTRLRGQHAALILLATTLAACAPLPPHSGPSRGPHPDARRPDVRPHEAQRPPETGNRPAPRGRSGASSQRHAAALRDGIALYHDGKYDAAIARLGAVDTADAAGADRLEALKYMAFSYCVSRREAQCRASFERALRLDPRFDLGPGEHGHPMWGPVFEKARGQRR